MHDLSLSIPVAPCIKNGHIFNLYITKRIDNEVAL